MSITKDWTHEDNFTEMQKGAERRETERVMEDLVSSALIRVTHQPTPDARRRNVGVIVMEKKAEATPEELAALSRVKGDTHTAFTRYTS